MKYAALSIPLVLAAVILAQGQGSPGTPTATAQRIDDNRYGQLDPKYMSTGHTTSTGILLKVTGLPFKPARAGGFKFTEIKDDAGTDLMKLTQEFPPITNGMINIYNASPDNSFTLTMNLGKSPRKATKLTSIKEEFTVTGGGEAKEVTVAGFAAHGKTIENEDFKKIGITVTTSVPADANGQWVVFEVTGPSEAITEMQLLAADGKAQPSSFTRQPPDAGKTGEKLFLAGGKIDGTMSAKIKYVVGQQKAVLPIDLKDIALP
jgi:hypothetical protein